MWYTVIMNKTTDVRSGYCSCGCGQKTSIAKQTVKRLGHIKGQPIRYIHGHQMRRPDLIVPDSPNPSGYCQCGCGSKTPLAKRNNYEQGHVKDHPVQFLRGHHIRLNNPGPRKQVTKDGLIVCTKCGQRLHRDQFDTRKDASNGLQSHCKDCRSSRYNTWQKNNPENCINRDQRSRLRRKYGIDQNVYLNLLHEQNYCCAICHRPERRVNRTGNPMPLSVDHDHSTKKIRGLLCKSCNTAIGLLEDDPEIAKQAAVYLTP